MGKIICVRVTYRDCYRLRGDQVIACYELELFVTHDLGLLQHALLLFRQDTMHYTALIKKSSLTYA